MPRGSVAWTARRCGIGCTASMNGVPKGSRTAGRKATRRASRRNSWAQLAEVVETGPERAVHGVVRWRRVDLQQIVAERFGVAYHERTIGKILKQLGFSHVSARPRHPAKDEETGAAFKKTRRDAEHSPRRPAEGQADRDLVPGRSPHRPEERPRAAVGAARLAPTPARRSALRKRLPVRCHLPGARHRRGSRHALRRQRGDATPPRRDLEPRPARRPRRAPPRSGRLAYDRSPGRAEKHHPRLPALARPRAQSGREHLAVLAPELALEPRVRNLRSDHRSGLRRLA